MFEQVCNPLYKQTCNLLLVFLQVVFSEKPKVLRSALNEQKRKDGVASPTGRQENPRSAQKNLATHDRIDSSPSLDAQ